MGRNRREKDVEIEMVEAFTGLRGSDSERDQRKTRKINNVTEIER